MRTVKYIRVSTLDQNTDRQEVNGIDMYIDKCSGSIPFADRLQASRLLTQCQSGLIDMVEVHSIDRLGRNTIDIMTTIKNFTDMGVCVSSKKEGLLTLIDGKENPTAKLIINILATLSEFELNLMKERQREGIAKAKAKGTYKSNGGQKPRESVNVFLNKSKNKICLNEFKRGESVRRAAKLSGVSTTTAQKVKKLWIESMKFKKDTAKIG